MNQDLLIITVLGRDREGLVAEVTGVLADYNINIVDIEQTVIHGLFSMFMLVDLSESKADDETLRNTFFSLSNKLKVNIQLTPYSTYKDSHEQKRKELLRITLFGKDKPGIVAGFSKNFYEQDVNIENIKMIARGQLLVMEMIIDSSQADKTKLKQRTREVGEELSVDVVIQPENKTHHRKKLVVFDMDGTIIQQEVINELGKAAGVGDKVAEITGKGMRGEIDFKEGLIERVRLLEGLPVEVMEEIKDNLELTPHAQDLVKTLKGMGFKVALISGGFKYFTDALKQRLGFDYTYANELVIRDGKLTGEIKGDIIDSERKAEIMKELARKENISKEEIVAIGDGANDQIMLQNAGLGIAFDAEDILKKVADGSITKNNLQGLLFCLGATEEDVECL